MEQFIFFRNYYEALKDMPQKVQAETLMAIAGYMLDDVEPDLSGVSQAIFIMIRPGLDKSKARAAAGKIGGSAKRAESKTEANLKQNGSKMEAKPEQTASKPEAIKNKENKNKELRMKNEESNITILPVSDEDDGFDEFWDEYPRHVAKQAAKKAWDKLKPDAELRRKIIAAIREQKKSDQWTKDGGNYIPHPATWLNQARWEDELPEPAAPARQGVDRSQSNGVPGQHEMEAVQRLIRQHRQSG